MPTAQAHWSPVPPALTLRPGAGTPPPPGPLCSRRAHRGPGDREQEGEGGG